MDWFEKAHIDDADNVVIHDGIHFVKCSQGHPDLGMGFDNLRDAIDAGMAEDNREE